MTRSLAIGEDITTFRQVQEKLVDLNHQKQGIGV